MKKIRKHTARKWIVAILVAVVIFIGVVNVLLLKTKDFWSITASTCLTMIIALIVSYFFTQQNQDERNQKEAYLKIMEKLQDIVEDNCMVDINSDIEIEKIMTKKRALNNYIGLLKRYEKRFNVEDEIRFIREKADEYINFLSDHLDKIEYLSQSQKELSRPLELIDGKLCELMIKIFE